MPKLKAPAPQTTPAADPIAELERQAHEIGADPAAIAWLLRLLRSSERASSEQRVPAEGAQG